MTIAQQLVDVSNAKKAIKAAIELKGVTVGTSAFSTYAAKIGDITSGGSSTPTPKPYVRPSDWLALPTLTETDQKFVGLHMVAEDSNFLALTAAGNYTVDWGDGTIQDFAANVVAEHTYDFANVNLGAVTANGWKQAIVTLTPQAGQNLTALNLHKKHSQLGLPTYSSGFVDIAIAGSLLTSLLLGSVSNAAATQAITFRDLEQVKVVKSAITNWGYVFYGCSSLVIVVTLDIAACTNATQMFYNCYSLQTVPLFNLAACTNATSMFYNCYSLQTVPLFNLAACTNATSMFQNCSSLQTVPLFNLAACTSATSMFQNCSSLQTVPLFNLAACTNALQMFSSCPSLVKGVCSGTKTSISYTSNKLSATELNAIYTALATVVGQTITVTGNWGAATDNPTIATSKGWTVIG
jgi:hypothetical protein